MRKGFKKFITFATAAVMTIGALSLAACGSNFQTPNGIPEGETISNGGFVVEKGDYYYFINGVESYTADNTYGTPVRGALMRILKSDVAKKENKSEVVIPSLMVAGDSEAGLYIYGDRIYYATPNNVRATDGTMQEGFLDFKSAKLDGTDIQDLFRLESNTTTYRYVEVDGTVYVMYVTSNDIYSYNTESGTTTLLVDNASTTPVFNKTDKTDPTVYYTMAVTDYADTDNSVRHSYNQVYRVRADATEAPYEYQWDEEYVEEELGGQYPYVNLGEIVLDGRGSEWNKTQYSHADDEPTSPFGYTYTLQSYQNGGIYFTRTQLTTTGSVGEDGSLYYLAEADMTATNSVSLNDGDTLDVVAQPVNTSKATSSALYYIEEGVHHYLYLSSNNTIYRVTVDEHGNNTEEQPIAYSVSGATLVSIDNTTSDEYHYLYFSRTNGSGRSIERAVYNGDPIVYENLQYSDPVTGELIDNKPYQPVKVLDIEHANSWYNFELIGTDLFYADADSDVASTSFNYINTVSLANENGDLMNNVELAAFTEKYNAIMSSDSKVGLLANLSANSNSKLSTAIKYYFYTGVDTAFAQNIKEAKDAGKKDTYLYTDAEQDAFYAFVNNEGYTDENGNVLFTAEDYKDYRTLSSFVTFIGQMREEDIETREEYWRGALQRYTVPAEEKEPLPDWAIALIVVGSVLVAAVIAGIVVLVVLKKKKAAEAPVEQKMVVDTTDDRSVDVYADEPAEAAVEPEEVPAEEPVEEVTEEPAEPPAEEVTEEPAEAPAETPAEPTEE